MPEQVYPIEQGRDTGSQLVSYIRLNLKHGEPLQRYFGTLPKGAIITSLKAYIKTGFTGAKLAIGKGVATDKSYGEKDVATAAKIVDYTPQDAKCFVGNDAELVLYCSFDKTAAAGEGSVIIEYITNN